MSQESVVSHVTSVVSLCIVLQVKDVMRDVAGDLRQTNLERTLLTWCQTNTAGSVITPDTSSPDITTPDSTHHPT